MDKNKLLNYSAFFTFLLGFSIMILSGASITGAVTGSGGQKITAGLLLGLSFIGLSAVLVYSKKESSSINTIDDLIANSAVKLEAQKGKDIYYLFDTGALSNLYKDHDANLLEYFDNPVFKNANIVVTQEVFEELERQRDTKRKDDDKNYLSPFGLLNQLYELEGKGKIDRLSAAPETKEQKKVIHDGFSKSAKNTTGNVRLGKGDYSILNFAHTYKNDDNAYCVLVSPDSDIVYALGNLGIKNAEYVSAPKP